jgi:hypothetical protein
VSELTFAKLLESIKAEPPSEWVKPIFVAPNKAFADAARAEFGDAVQVIEQSDMYMEPAKP